MHFYTYWESCVLSPYANCRCDLIWTFWIGYFRGIWYSIITSLVWPAPAPYFDMWPHSATVPFKLSRSKHQMYVQHMLAAPPPIFFNKLIYFARNTTWTNFKLHPLSMLTSFILTRNVRSIYGKYIQTKSITYARSMHTQYPKDKNCAVP